MQMFSCIHAAEATTCKSQWRHLQNRVFIHEFSFLNAARFLYVNLSSAVTSARSVPTMAQSPKMYCAETKTITFKVY